MQAIKPIYAVECEGPCGSRKLVGPDTFVDDWASAECYFDPVEAEQVALAFGIEAHDPTCVAVRVR